MLTAFLKSISDKYTIEFRNDAFHKLLFVTVIRDVISHEEAIPFSLLSDERCIVRAIRKAIEEVEFKRRKACDDQVCDIVRDSGIHPAGV